MGLGGRRNARTGRVKRGVWDENTGRLVSSLFVSKHPVLASWNPGVRMKDEVVGDYNLRKLPNCQSPQSRLQP